jgi:hypothetical protein
VPALLGAYKQRAREPRDRERAIWSGERGSPAYYEGTFTNDDTLTGAWHYPGGGGYKTVATRVSAA